MTRTTERTITYSRDPSGREVAHVPLARRSETAAIYRDDLERLTTSGVPFPWYLNTARCCSYVSAYDPDHLGKNQTVARRLIDAPKGRIVKYRDGDRLNLRRDNLYLTEGASAKGKTPATKLISAKTHEGGNGDA